MEIQFNYSSDALFSISNLKLHPNATHSYLRNFYGTLIPQPILGYPVAVNQAMESIAPGKKTVLFGDMKKYYVGKVGAPALYVARERFAPDFGILGFVRFDGCLSNTAAIKHLVQA